MVVFLWSAAMIFGSVFAWLLAHTVLTPKITGARFVMWWIMTGIVGFILTHISYSINLYNDAFGALGLPVILCAAIVYAYQESVPAKLFVGMMASLTVSVITFMFCGSLDNIIGGRLGFFAGGTPYTVENILLFMGIKVVVFSIIYVLFLRFVRGGVKEVLGMAGEELRTSLVVPAVSIVGFYVINLITNSVGIIPTSPWFMPLYMTVCIIFGVEFAQILGTVRANAEKMQSEKEKERIGAELNVANQIQADMLPRIFPPFPERKDFDIYATMTPAKEVGGDFYDFFLIDDDHLGLVMADVSGKGVPAALFMVIAKTLIKNHAQLGEYSPAKVLMQTNEQLCEGNEAELFVTVWLAIWQISTGKGLAANAGHEHPVLRRAGGTYELVKYRHSPAVATMEGMRFREHEFELHPGDSLFVYTDGVPEATNEKDELYGTDRMLDALNADPAAAPKEAIAAVKKSVDEFAAGTPQFDDITMMCLQYSGSEKDSADNERVLDVPADDQHLTDVLAFVTGILEEHGGSMKTQMLVEVSIEELFVNIAHYAYPEGNGWAQIRARVEEDNTAVITLIDGGIPYDPLAKEDPDVTLSAEEREIGGLGIFMAKKNMDEMTYKYEDGKNILTCRKKIS
ncbi:MAG: SpoIIE family protein phosphatase [Lachnospiraceae bacterium]|nr:SpoIIE family protein phosphatase [Lachnospiraceae bacterium]